MSDTDEDDDGFDDEPVALTAKAQIAELDLSWVRVEGRYEELDARMRPEGEPVYSGHVVIRMDDGTPILLEPVWEPEAIRSQAEREALRGRRVVVVGVLFAEAPPNPSNPGMSNLLLPCLSGIRELQALE